MARQWTEAKTHSTWWKIDKYAPCSLNHLRAVEVMSFSPCKRPAQYVPVILWGLWRSEKGRLCAPQPRQAVVVTLRGIQTGDTFSSGQWKDFEEQILKWGWGLEEHVCSLAAGRLLPQVSNCQAPAWPTLLIPTTSKKGCYPHTNLIRYKLLFFFFFSLLCA